MSNLVTIVPAEGDPGRPRKTQGTQVLLADGTRLEGVLSVALFANAQGIWEATIRCVVAPPELEDVLAKIEATAYQSPESGEYGEATRDQIMRGLASQHRAAQERQA